MTAHEDILKEARRIDTAHPSTELKAIPLEEQESPLTGERQVTDNVKRFVSENPGPALLIGAGLAWLFVNRERQRTRSLPTRLKDRAHDVKLSARESYHDAKLQTTQTLSNAKSSAAHGLEHAKDATAQRLDTAKTYASQKAQLARRRYDTMLNENPLALGACAVAAGLAIGLLFPATHKENELLGETRDSLLEQAKTIVNEARAAAVSTLRANRDSVEQKLVEARDEMTEAVKESVEEAKQSFKSEVGATDESLERKDMNRYE